MSDPITLSASSVTTYQRCHYQYYLSEIMRIPSPPNIAMALGTAFHASIERLWKGSPLRPVDKLAEVFAEEMEKVQEPDEDPAVALRDGMLMLATYTEKVYPRLKPSGVEVKLVAEIEGVHWSGILDFYDENDVRDAKSTAGKTINGRKPNFNPDKHQLQLTGYRWLYRALTGRWPKRLLLDVVTRTGKYREYEIEPDTGGLLDVIRLTRDGILRRNYEPTGVLSNSCFMCPYRNICEFSNAIPS